MAYAESPTRVNVEFLKSSGQKGRVIRLNHQPSVVPPQLAGRIDPGTWAQFMGEVADVANRHPYVIPPNAKQAAGWAGCLAVGAVLGFCCLNPDGGDYSQWTAEVQQVVQRWRPGFGQNGCTVTFVHGRNSYIQIDVDPHAPMQQFKAV